jgi:hypothetical protein
MMAKESPSKWGFLRLHRPKMGFRMEYKPSTRVDNSWNIFFIGKMTEERQ